MIEQRTATLYQIQQKSKDRRFLICVFALTGHQANVIFIDCWRRWRKWITMRMSWRLAARQCRFEWSNMKVSTIFKAWRALTSYKDPDFVQEALVRTEGTSKTRQSILKKQAAEAIKLAALNKDQSTHDTDENSIEESTVSGNDYDDDDVLIYENVIDGEADDAEAEYSDMSDEDEGDYDMDALNESTAGFLKNIAVKNRTQSSSSVDGSHEVGVVDAADVDMSSDIKKGRRKNRKGSFFFVLVIKLLHVYMYMYIYIYMLICLYHE